MLMVMMVMVMKMMMDGKGRDPKEEETCTVTTQQEILKDNFDNFHFASCYDLVSRRFGHCNRFAGKITHVG